MSEEGDGPPEEELDRLRAASADLGFDQQVRPEELGIRLDPPVVPATSLPRRVLGFLWPWRWTQRDSNP